LAVLLLAGFLTSVSPPHAAAAAPAVFAQQGDRYLVHLTVGSPPRLGGSGSLSLVIEEAASGAPLLNNTCGRASCVTVEIGYAGVAGNETHQALLHGGAWVVGDLVWARAGKVAVQVGISSTEVYHDEVAFHLDVAG
jgi:hypothetical protein